MYHFTLVYINVISSALLVLSHSASRGSSVVHFQPSFLLVWKHRQQTMSPSESPPCGHFRQMNTLDVSTGPRDAPGCL